MSLSLGILIFTCIVCKVMRKALVASLIAVTGRVLTPEKYRSRTFGYMALLDKTHIIFNQACPHLQRR